MAVEDERDPVAADHRGLHLRYSERNLLEDAQRVALIDEPGAGFARRAIEVIERLGRLRSSIAEPETGEHDPPTTPWEIREALRRELAWFISAQGLDGTPIEPVQIDVDEYAVPVRIVRDLAAAVESADRFAFQAAQTVPSPVPFDVDELAVQLWNASQDAGGSTAVGDAVVAELRKAVGNGA